MATRSPSRSSNTPVLLHYSTAQNTRSETSPWIHTLPGHDNISMKNEWWKSTYGYVTFIKTDYYQLNLKKKTKEVCKCFFVSSVSSKGVGFEIDVGFHFLIKVLIKWSNFLKNQEFMEEYCTSSAIRWGQDLIRFICQRFWLYRDILL